MAVLNPNDAGGYIVGADTGETISVLALAPAAGADTGVDVLAGTGNDSITGHDGHNYIDPNAGDDTVAAGGGSDYIQASAGADSVDGGAGDDVLAFTLADGTEGALHQETDGSGNVLVKLDGVTILTIGANQDGSFLVTGAAGTAGAAFGTETVTGIEQIRVSRPAGSATGDTGATLDLAMQVKLFPNGGANGGWALGSIQADTINLDTAFPGIVASTDGSWVQGAGADGGAGNDAITGTGGSDYIVASAGDDTVDGGAGHDSLSFQLVAGATGALSQDLDSQGNIVVKLDNTVILTVTAGAGGSYVLTGAAGTAGAVFGTETISNIEQLSIQRQPSGEAGDTGSYLNFNPGVEIYRNGAQQGGWVRGTAAGDSINLGTIFSDITASSDGSWVQGAGADGGGGNDTVTGTAGGDYIYASGGDDTINGGSGNDSVSFQLAAGSTGTLTQDVDSDGNIVAKLDGTVILTITGGSGAYTVTGAAGTAGAAFGTEVLTSIEDVNIYRPSTGADDSGSWLSFGLGMQVFSNQNQAGGWVRGSVGADTIDLATLFPGIIASTDGSWVNGAGADGGAGNDTITGTAGSDHLSASLGNDVIHGGAGRDSLSFSLPDGATGTLAHRSDGGNLLVTLDGVTVFTISANQGGGYTITGAAGTAGASFGTETVDSVENLSFYRNPVGGDAGSSLYFGLGVEVFSDPNGSGGWVRGSAMDDSINLATTFPAIQPGTGGGYVAGAGVNPDAGNDSVTGSAGFDYIEASAGNDVIDGGAGDDSLSFNLAAGSTGTLAATAPANGGFSVTLDGVAIATVTAGANGAYVIAGIDGTAGAQFGTETVSNIERVQFYRPASGAGDDGSWLNLDMALQVYRFEQGNGGYVRGSFQADNVDMAALFTGITASTDGSWVQGAGIDPGAGDDTVAGTAGSDHFSASQGNDTLNGGAGDDNLSFNLAAGSSGTLATTAPANGGFSVTLDGVAIATVTAGTNGAYVIAGIDGTAGAQFGTETVSNIERVQFYRPASGAGDDGSWLNLDMALQVYRSEQGNGGYVRGSFQADTVDMAALFTGITASTDGSWVQGAGIDPGAGDDTVAGTAGSDHFSASPGNDTLNGGAGQDTLSFQLGGEVTGALTQDVDSAGNLVIKLDGTTILQTAHNANGTLTVTGVAGTAGAAFGAETATGIEALSVYGGSGAGIYLQLGQQVFHNSNNNGGWVMGSSLNDTINLATEFPGITAGADGAWAQGAGADPGNGNDTVTGTAGSDYIQASAGADTVDGAGGVDDLHFSLSGGGVLSQATGSDGNLQIKLDGVAVFTLAGNQDGSYTVTGVAGTAGAHYGTETIRNIERLHFYSSADGQSSSLDVQLGMTVSRNQDGIGGFVTGSSQNDIINLAAQFPELTGGTDGWSRGASADPGDGDDAVTGSPGGDYITASAGNDVSDGGASMDSLQFYLPSNSGTVSYASGSNGEELVKLNGVTAFTIARNQDGSTTVTGMAGTAGAAFGSETVRNVENLNFIRFTSGAEGDTGSQLTVVPEVQVYPEQNGAVARVVGATRGDQLDLTALVPGVDSRTDGLGVSVDGQQGDDTILGTKGNDFAQASEGSDVSDGAAGHDTISFHLGEGQGKFSHVVGSNGDLQIQLGGTTVFNVVRNQDGGYTVTGVEGTAAARLGSETLRNFEALSFSRGGYDESGNWGDTLNLDLAMHVSADSSSVAGSSFNDTINLATLFPNISGSTDGSWVTGANANGGLGDDTITGTAASDFISASAGNDSVAGGAGSDTLSAFLQGKQGSAVLSSELGDNGTALIKLDATTVALVSRLADGAIRVAGVAGTPGEVLGTQTLTGVENLSLNSHVPGTDGGSGSSGSLHLALTETVQHFSSGGGYVTGSFLGETINLSALFPEMAAAADGVSMSSSVNPDGGDDIVTGTAYSDFVTASAGNDSIDGGAGFDYLQFSLPYGTMGQIAYAEAGDGSLLLQLDGVTVASVARQGDGAFMLTGVAGTAGAALGTEALTSVESILFTPPANSDGEAGQALSGDLTVRVMQAHHVRGSVFSETLDLAALFPDIVAATDGSVPDGANADAGAGNDIVLGTAGADWLAAGAGNDVLTGGAGVDTLSYLFASTPADAVFSHATLAGGDHVVKLGEEVVLTLHQQDDGAILLTGSGAGAGFGTETLRQVEALWIDYGFGTTGQPQHFSLNLDFFL